MKIAVIGGGNIGMLLAAEFSHRSNDVFVYTHDAKRWNPALSVYDAKGNLIFDNAFVTATNDLAVAVSDAEYVFITYPVFLFPTFAIDLEKLIGPNQKVGVIPGACGEFYFNGIVEKGGTLFGLQRVHSVARLKERGKSVFMLGRKPSIQIAAIPSVDAGGIADDLELLLEMPVAVLPNYLSLTLVPSNPILHTSRIATMFSDWHPGMTYPRNFLFYEEWDNEASALMMQCDSELQKVCHRIPLDLTSVRSLREHYESQTIEEMTSKISGIEAFKGIESPMKKASSEGWEPDFDSRYFKSDFAFGLKAIVAIAALANVPVRHMQNMLSWYCQVSLNGEGFVMPFKSLGELLNLYAYK